MTAHPKKRRTPWVTCAVAWCIWVSPAWGTTSPVPIMPLTEYAKVQHDRPYVLAVCAAQGRLDYLGVAHTMEPDGEAVGLIRAQYQREPPDIVYVEGPAFEPKASLEESVQAYGEAGALLFLERKDGRTVRTLDLSVSDEMSVVSARFGRDWALAFYGVRIVAQERARHQGAELASFVTEKLLPWLSRNISADRVLTLDEFLSTVRGVSPELADWNQVSREWFDPIERHPQRMTNVIAGFLVEARDRRMVERLGDNVRDGKRVLAVAGYSHVVVQEPALVSRLGCSAGASTGRSPSVHRCHASCSPNPGN